MDLAWTLVHLILLIIDWISIISAKILSIFSIIYLFVLIKRLMFKNEVIVNPKETAVLITGCDSGFGSRLAIKLNRLGYRVYATVLKANSAQHLIEESPHKDQMVVWKMDVTLDEDVKDVYSKVIQDLESHGCALWAVVNNAGYGILTQLEWIDLAQFKTIFEVNVFGMVRVTKTFLPLIRQSKGRIVNMSSQMGLLNGNGFGVYSMTKYAVTAFSRTLRQELSKCGVKVVTLYPGGYNNTNFGQSMINTSEKIWNQMDDSLKSVYGHKEYFEMWKRRELFNFKLVMNDRPDSVIDAMVEGITHSEAKLSYQPNDNLLPCLAMFLLKSLPSTILDIIDSY